MIDHLPDEHKNDVKRKMQNAYGMVHYGDAKRALHRIASGTHAIHPSAARSLEEGLKGTLTAHRLRVPEQLRANLLQHKRDRIGLLDCGDGLPQYVKPWLEGDQIERRVASGLLVAEGRVGR